MPTDQRPPRDNLIRTQPGKLEMRAKEGGMPTLYGHLAVFDQWTEIHSIFEGDFMERIAPGAFSKTMKENRAAMKVTFNHGQDPSMGDKVLGPITELREDATGAYYEVPLLDTSYNRDLAPGLEAGLYGASFRFRVMREEFDQRAKPSDYNPSGLPERTVKELAMAEFGPVTFPAYEGASAGVRSLTDLFLVDKLTRNPERLRELVDAIAPSRPGAAVTPHLEPKRREAQVAVPVPVPKFKTREAFLEWISKI